MPGTNLTREEALTRAGLLHVDRYDVELDLTTSPETFRSRTTVHFTCARPGERTFIDLVSASVEAVTLNGAALDPAVHADGHRVTLPGLQAGNVLVVEATCRYMNTGEGLHRCSDPVDGEVYLYSQFEVADSRRVFAVFEQPDLKAEFAFTVTAPAHWQVISCSASPEPEPLPSEPEPLPSEPGTATRPAARWTFSPTPRLSSYVTAIHAGPYAVVHDSVQTRRGVVPLRILCRASLLPHLDAGAIFDVTKRGFAFFEEEFDYAYPFDTYDQVFAPEYNVGAMENAAAVTISEIYIFRSQVAEMRIERRVLTILHELAHMWFGDLVTMRWWDDLWLNESFAEWASTACQAEATRWASSWTTFALTEKTWAYAQDQLSSTHPIRANMRHLEDVESNFDGITYAKGAAALKQLVAFVGRTAFRDAVRAYFAAHAWSSTELRDLTSELERASGRDLGHWVQAWLETAGVNRLAARFEVGPDDRYISFALEQTATADLPTLRPHRLGIGRYDVRDGRLVRVGYDEADIDGPLTQIPALVGAAQPDLLLVNDEDLTYATIRLDERSLATALAHPRGFTDSLPAAIVLGAAWDMTRSAEMPARSFLALALASLPGETNSTMLSLLLSEIQSAVLYYVTPPRRDETRQVAAQRLRELALAAEPRSDAQHQLIRAYAGMATGEESAAHLQSLLDGTSDLEGLDIDTELRWLLLRAVASLGHADAEAIAAEAARDATATGHEREAQTLAARPTAEAKAQAWTRAVERTDATNAIVEALGLGFVRTPDTSSLEPYVERYHDALLGVWSTRTVAVGTIVVQGFYPMPLAGQPLLDATQAWLDAHPDAPAGLLRLVGENRDEVARAVAAQSLDATLG